MKRTKVICAAVAALTLFALLEGAIAVPAHAAEAKQAPSSVMIVNTDGTKSRVAASEYVIENGVLMVAPSYVNFPFVVAAKGIGFGPEAKTLNVLRFDLSVIGEKSPGFSIKLGEKEFADHSLGKTLHISQPALARGGHIYLPLRTISEAYGYVVDYAKQEGVITISIHK
ncbi:hypothetical protein A8990_11469 [Paenibacillus taihuensis]|uniref:Copper amine oxidase-like protein n=1 Tax=Paenibacillus taihuensis TaxID=1156355 RepID=A0A3D9S3N7_9BACL|nr:hypothetical protein [Paenibacillus taihuensis]REE84534.1 hypothetical protein A8990_11469 [Paenibacillus taihuensis]